ncbi:MAG: type II toxin-antitoxin system RelE/ParE family toxin [Vicinamibacteria bacterium]
MRYEVRLTRSAERDVRDIYDYIAELDSPNKASAVLDRLLKTAEDLATLPSRGSYPKELVDLGIKEYRQVIFKPYRIIYRVVGSIVYVYIVADGRRNMQTLLPRRLLGA